MFQESYYDLLKDYLLRLVPDLTENTWLAFREKCTVKEYKQGDYMYRQGDVCNHISFLCSGLLRCYYITDDGKEVITAFVYEGDYYSDYESFLTRKPTNIITKLMEDTTVLNVSYQDLQSLYDLYPQSERVGRLIAENLFIILSNRTSSFQFESPEVRYKKFLQGNEPLIQRIPLYMVASYIGITPEALSRIRNRIRP